METKEKNPETAITKVDVALNIFAKPLQTSLALLSLVKHCRKYIDKIWLQYEPVGSCYDKVNPYVVMEYITQTYNIPCIPSQPDIWIDLEAADIARFGDKNYRMAIRYQNAFENSKSKMLFVMHNDIVILKDIIGDMLDQIGDAFAICQIGQCWNCPAKNSELAKEVLGCGPCSPAKYDQIKPSYKQLCQLYKLAKEKNIFVRPYDEGFEGYFDKRPWPLPECRVNEWACLVNLEKVQSSHLPFGNDFPFGGYLPCGPINLDIGVAWFRDMHSHGFHARHFDMHGYIKHWVGTGNNTPHKYAINENNALLILKRNFKDYLKWLESKTGIDFSQQ